MRPLSMDLRERIVVAYGSQEGSYAVLAVRFSVSRAVVGKLVRQQRDQGTLESQFIGVAGSRPSAASRRNDWSDTSETIRTPRCESGLKRWGWTVP